MKRKQSLVGFCLLFILSQLTLSCIYHQTRAFRAESVEAASIIKSPTKVHLYDGSLFVFPEGFVLKDDIITGYGIRYDFARTDVIEGKQNVAQKSVAFIEYYEKRIQAGPIIGGASAPVLFNLAIQNPKIYKAFFGSCPTLYSFDGKDFHLQAESFSYSVSRNIETEDLDRIEQGKTLNEHYFLNVRNEALETHYINSMKLLVVDHPKEYEPFPENRSFLSRKDRIILFGRESRIIKATSRTGRNVKPLLSARDGLYYTSDTSLVHELTKKVNKDWVEVEVIVPNGAKTMVVALRFRNTLFHTVQFYDVTLKRQGFYAVDWLGQKMTNPLYLNQLYNRYKRYFGIWVELWNGSRYLQKEFVDDTGPIAWHQVAFKLPVPKENTAKLRLRFLPDNIMLDWVGISFEFSDDLVVREIKCSGIIDTSGVRSNISSSLIDKKDNKYLVTYPTDSYLLSFKMEDKLQAQKRSYFLNSCGFYIEWIRGDWFRYSQNILDKKSFQLNESSIKEAAKIWISKKASFERQFFNSRATSEGRGIK